MIGVLLAVLTQHIDSQVRAPLPLEGAAGPGLLRLRTQDVPPEFSKFEFARERIEHKVSADVVLVNRARTELTELRVTILFYDQDREVKRSKAQTVARIAPGGSAAFKIETVQVENFSRYEVLVEQGRKQRLYLGSNPERPPLLKKAEPAKLALTASQDTPPAAAPGDVALALTVRNAGESDAHEPHAVVTFLDAKNAPVRKVRARLGSMIQAACEDTFEVTVPAVPAYAKAQVALAFLVSELPAWPEGPADAKEVDLRKNRILRFSDGVLCLTGTVRNGLGAAVKGVKATFKIGRESHLVTLEGVLGPGQTRDIELVVPDPGGDAASFQVGYDDAGAAAATAPPAAPKAVSKRTETKVIETAPLVKPPAVKTPEKPADSGPPKLSAGLKGMGVVDGYPLKNGTYSGDVPFVRLVFTDADGKPVQPTGTMNVVVYEGDRPVKKVQRIITKESWKLDIGKVTNLTVRHDILALDPKTNELWVAFHRSDGGPLAGEPKVDVSLAIRDAGTWEWKAVGPKTETALRGPDKK